MSSGWAFALGWIGCNAFIAWGIPSPLEGIGSLLRDAGHRLRRRKLCWTIGETTWYGRPLTRTVMEQVASLQSTDVPVPLMVHLGMASAETHDELAAARKQMQADHIRAIYEVCAVILMDENGEPPNVEWLGDTLTIDEAGRITNAVMSQ